MPFFNQLHGNCVVSITVYPTYTICVSSFFLPAELASCNDWSKSDFTRVVFSDRCVDWTKPVVFPVGTTIAEIRFEAHAQFQEWPTAITHCLAHPESLAGIFVANGTDTVLPKGRWKGLEALELGNIPATDKRSSKLYYRYQQRWQCCLTCKLDPGGPFCPIGTTCSC